MYKYYKISEIADLLGVTSETIRHYERKNIITPFKTEGNNYRNYNIWDLSILLRARALRELGFSIDEITEIFENNSATKLPEMLKQRENEIKNEIKRNFALLKSIGSYKSFTENVERAVGKYKLVVRPAMYRLESHSSAELIDDKKAASYLKQWSEYAHYIFTGNRFYLSNDKASMLFGCCVDSHNEFWPKFIEDDYVKYHAPALSVHTIMKAASTSVTMLDEIKPVIDFVRLRGLEIIDDIIGRGLVFKRLENYFDQSVFEVYYDVWIPIKIDLGIE